MSRCFPIVRLDSPEGTCFFFQKSNCLVVLKRIPTENGVPWGLVSFFFKLRFKIRLPHIHVHKTKLKKDDTDGDLKSIRVFGKSLVPNLSAREPNHHIYPST